MYPNRNNWRVLYLKSTCPSSWYFNEDIIHCFYALRPLINLNLGSSPLPIIGEKLPDHLLFFKLKQVHINDRNRILSRFHQVLQPCENSCWLDAVWYLIQIYLSWEKLEKVISIQCDWYRFLKINVSGELSNGIWSTIFFWMVEVCEEF